MMDSWKAIMILKIPPLLSWNKSLKLNWGDNCTKAQQISRFDRKVEINMITP